MGENGFVVRTLMDAELELEQEQEPRLRRDILLGVRTGATGTFCLEPGSGSTLVHFPGAGLGAGAGAIRNLPGSC